VSENNGMGALLASRLFAALMLGCAVLELISDFRGFARPPQVHFSWHFVDLSFLPTSVDIVANLAFYLWLACIGFMFVRDSKRTDARVLLLTIFGSMLLRPLWAIWPSFATTRICIHTGLMLLATMAGASLCLHNWSQRKDDSAPTP